MTRPSFESVILGMAELISRRSTCSRLNVGCVIASTDFRQILGAGYNGGARGQENECVGDPSKPGSCGCLHAESNAIVNMAHRAPEMIVFCTHLPCPVCARMLVNLGGEGSPTRIVRVFWNNDYRIKDGLEILRRGGIPEARFSIPPIVQG